MNEYVWSRWWLRSETKQIGNNFNYVRTTYVRKNKSIIIYSVDLKVPRDYDECFHLLLFQKLSRKTRAKCRLTKFQNLSDLIFQHSTSQFERRFDSLSYVKHVSTLSQFMRAIDSCSCPDYNIFDINFHWHRQGIRTDCFFINNSIKLLWFCATNVCRRTFPFHYLCSSRTVCVCVSVSKNLIFNSFLAHVIVSAYELYPSFVKLMPIKNAKHISEISSQ